MISEQVRGNSSQKYRLKIRYEDDGMLSVEECEEFTKRIAIESEPERKYRKLGISGS